MHSQKLLSYFISPIITHCPINTCRLPRLNKMLKTELHGVGYGLPRFATNTFCHGFSSPDDNPRKFDCYTNRMLNRRTIVGTVTT